MRLPYRFPRHVWLLAPALAIVLSLWITVSRVERIEQLTQLPFWSVDPPARDARSPTGYANGRRTLLIPEHSNESYQWILQTQLVLATGEWRVRRVDYDNAPWGRDVRQPSNYRGWLAAVAWADHLLSGRPLPLAAERAALWSDPLLQLILLLGATGLTALAFGRWAAACVALGTVALFPLGGAFLAGAPDRQALALLCVTMTVLPLVGVVHAGALWSPRRKRVWFLLSAISGAIGLWTNADLQWPVLAGIVVGAGIAAWLSRGREGRALPWRWWGLVGCAATLLTYSAENYPDRIGWDFGPHHPVFALAWWGAGELLDVFAVAFSPAGAPPRGRQLGRGGLARLLVALAPVAFVWSGDHRWLADDPIATRLTLLQGGIAAPSFAAWLTRSGSDGAFWAAILPWLVLVPVTLWRAVRRQEDPSTRAALLIGSGPLLAVTTIACFQLRAWTMVDALLLCLVPVLLAPSAASSRRRWRPLLLGMAWLVALLFGFRQQRPVRDSGAELTLSDLEVQGLVERDLAHWLAQRAMGDRSVVLAPPDLTMSLIFHGGLRGVVTLFPENHDGVAAAVRIASATSRNETLELCRSRGLDAIVVPSWDPFLDEFARMGTGMPENAFVEVLHRFALPNWLRPWPYGLPKISGREGLSVSVFAVTTEQPEPIAASRMAEYFLETGRAAAADAMAAELRRYPANLSALTALAQIAAIAGDREGFARAADELLSRATPAALRQLPWDRRISLVLVLAQARHRERAVEEAKRCLAQIDAERIRTLTTGTLWRFQIFCKSAGLEVADPTLRSLTRELLPPELRQRL